MSRIKNSLETSPTLSTLWEMYFDMKEGRIITIPPFLQRYLQESAWVKKEHKKAKEYLHSAFTATSLFEPFILVSIDLLIKNLSSDIKQWNEDGSSEMVLQAKKALDDLKKKKSKGAKWAMIDGQSRNMLALKPFFESDIAIDKSMIIEHFDKETKKLQSTEDVNGVFFEDMSLETKQLLKTIEAFVVRIEGGNIDNIVSALIAKQQGIPFTAFQKIYHGKYISVFANRLEKYITIAITDGYKKYIAQKDKFKAEESGLEYFFATLSIFFKYRNWPSNSKIENVMHGVEDVPTTTTLSKIKKYTNEYLDYFGSIDEKDVQKYSSKVLQNYILFRWYLDNWNKKESFFSQYNLPEIKIIAQNSFVKAFIEIHTILMDKKNPESYEKIKGEYHRKKPSYPEGCNNDSTVLIEWRIMFLTAEFKKKLEQLKKENVLITENINMPEMESVKVSSGFKDMDGDEVDPREKYHRGHIQSVFNGGSNELDNLTPQTPEDNLEYNKRNIVK
tara:strand:+ start:133 stop:1641 length:1509 start_codon:yes stop_codon:yes gene_type:complete